MSISLETLTANAKERADLADTSFVTTANWYMLINKGRRELHDLLVTADGRYFEKTATASTVVGQEDYTLPTGSGADAHDGPLHKLLSAEIQNASGYWVDMKPYRHSDRNILRVDSGILSAAYSVYFYDLIGDSLRILPAPTAVRTYRLRYLAYPTDLVASPGTPNTLTGIEEHNADYIEVYAAMWARIKAEKDVTEWRKERSHIRDRIETNASGRDRGAPRVLGGGPTRYPGTGWFR